MNSYNENLRTSVVNSLDAQGNALKKSQSALSAQEISLYYTQGALISANDKFDATLKIYEDQQDILASVNENNNAAINTVDAATQEKKYVDQTISNTAVAASNVQVASNAIVALAGDIGNVFSIVQAADYKSQIYDQALDAKNYMDKTAYNAKLASQWAMESTMKASSITASTVLTEAQSTGAALQALNDSYKGQFDQTAALLNAENDAVVLANNNEKKAEGLTEDLNTSMYGAESAYVLNNAELNSGLKVLRNYPSNPVPNMTDESFKVQFTPFIAPFTLPEDYTEDFPVAQYYLIVVDSSSKSTFSTTSADTAVNTAANSDGQLLCVEVDQTDRVVDTENNPLYTKEVQRATILDSNGKAIELGKEYCIFLYVKLADQYKKDINNYSDVLSAGSETFVLTKQLGTATNFSYIHAATGNAGDVPSTASVPATEQEGGLERLALNDSIQFSVVENTANQVSYRMMLLPTSPEKVGNLLACANLRTIQGEDELRMKYEKAANEVVKAKSAYDKKKDAHDVLVTKQKNKGDDLSDSQKAKLTKDIATAKAVMDKAGQLAGKVAGKSAVLAGQYLSGLMFEKGLFFNLDLAEQVPSGFYTEAINPTSTAIAGTDKATLAFEVKISDEMTDNFGNKLNNNDTYVPVVLSYSKETVNADKFSNALSDFEETTNFKFSSTKN